MIIGVPAEIKPSETKISLIPSSVKTLVELGNRVIIQKDAGKKSSFSNEEYIENGAEIVQTPKEIYQKSDIIIKINQPQPSEYGLLKEKQILTGCFNLFDCKDLMSEILEKRITTVDIKKIKTRHGTFPVENAISEIAGKTIIRIASSVLEKYGGGKLLCSTTGIKPVQITVIGSGAVGLSAAKTASNLGCNVTVLDTDIDKLQKIELLYNNEISTLFSNSVSVEKILPQTDILICAVKSNIHEILIKEKDVKLMKKGAVIIDTGLSSSNSVVETMDRILPVEFPVYEKHGVLHYCYNDISSLAPNTVSSAISEILTNYLLNLFKYPKFEDFLKKCTDIAEGILTYDGNITEESLAEHYCSDKYELSMLTGF